MKLELIKETEIELAFKILQDGVKRLKEQGIDQWQKGYPNIEAIEHDFNTKTGYLLKDKGNPVAYVSITCDKEDLYEGVKTWSCNDDYAIVHRVSIDNDYAGKGYAKVLFDEIKNMSRQLEVGCIRIDTHPNNKQMITVIERNGFVRTDEMMYREGMRVAFEHCLK